MAYAINSKCDQAWENRSYVSTQITLIYIMAHIFCSVCAIQTVNFIEFLKDFCIYDDISDMIQITDKKLLHFKLSKPGQFYVWIRPVF